MGYSLHVPLPRGTLKIKSKSRLRYRERYGEAAAFHLLSTYFVWEPKTSNSDQTEQSKNEERSGPTR
jgi:hypothetical protein